VTSKKICG
jgi:hypothetical protein